jgi:hypothetical protein
LVVVWVLVVWVLARDEVALGCQLQWSRHHLWREVERELALVMAMERGLEMEKGWGLELEKGWGMERVMGWGMGWVMGKEMGWGMGWGWVKGWGMVWVRVWVWVWAWVSAWVSVVMVGSRVVVAEGCLGDSPQGQCQHCPGRWPGRRLQQMHHPHQRRWPGLEQLQPKQVTKGHD